ncbi:MAG: acyl-[acyl-carrier-protein] thioesterase [Clostridium sp.]
MTEKEGKTCILLTADARYSEVDEDRKLSLTGVINYMQDCSTFQSEDLNMGIDYLAEKHRAWLLSSWQIVVDRYPKLGERIVVSTWPYDFKGIYGYRNFTIQDPEGSYLVRANSNWFFFDTGARCSCACWRRRYPGVWRGTGKKLLWTMRREKFCFRMSMRNFRPLRWRHTTLIPTTM